MKKMTKDEKAARAAAAARRVEAADRRMADLLTGALSVDDAVARLVADPEKLYWLPRDLVECDLPRVLARVCPLPAERVLAAYYPAQHAAFCAAAHAQDAAYYQALADRDRAASLERGEPQSRKDWGDDNL